MAWWLGVDLGTTFVAAAAADEATVEALTLGGSATTEPAVVLARPDGTVLVGERAVRRAVTEPTAVAREVKRRFGDPVPLVLDGVPWSADLLTAHVLRAIVDRVVTERGSWPDGLALTHPANWGEYKLELLRQVVERSGLGFLPTRFVAEPEAAALDHATRGRVAPGQVVAVYDLGGGTFDVAVYRCVPAPDPSAPLAFELLGPPQGIERLGGIDVDAAVLAHVDAAVGGAVGELAGPDHADDADAQAAVVDVRRACTEAKEQLSSDTDAAVRVVLPGRATQVVRLTRTELEAMVRVPIGETVDVTRRALAAAGVEPHEAHAVLLVGGSSRIPLVAEALARELGRPVLVDAHPKLAVARGAAVAARQAARGDAVGAAPATAPPGPGGPAASAFAAGPPAAATARRRRTVVGATAAAGLLVAAATGIALAGGDDDGGDGPGPTTTTEQAVPDGPVVEDRGDAWIDGGALIGAVGLAGGSDGLEVRHLEMAAPVSAPLALTDEVWTIVDDGAPSLQRADRETGELLDRVSLTDLPGDAGPESRLVPGNGAVWALVTGDQGTAVDRLDPATGDQLAQVELDGLVLGGEGAAVAVGDDLLVALGAPGGADTVLALVDAEGEVSEGSATFDGVGTQLGVDAAGAAWLGTSRQAGRIDLDDLSVPEVVEVGDGFASPLGWRRVGEELVLVISDDEVVLVVAGDDGEAEVIATDLPASVTVRDVVVGDDLWVAAPGPVDDAGQREPGVLARLALDGTLGEQVPLPADADVQALASVGDRPVALFPPPGIGIAAAHVLDDAGELSAPVPLEAMPLRLGVLDGRPVVAETGPGGGLYVFGDDEVVEELVGDLDRVRTPVPVGDELWVQTGTTVRVVGPGGVLVDELEPPGGGRVVVGDGGVLVGAGEGRVLVDPATRSPVGGVPGESQVLELRAPDAVRISAVGFGAAWDLAGSTLVRTDLATGARTEAVVNAALADLLVGSEFLWAGSLAGDLLQFDPTTGQLVDARTVGAGPVSVHEVDGDIWVVELERGDVHRFAVNDGAPLLEETYDGDGFATAAVVADQLWVARSQPGTLVRYDDEGTVGRPVELGGRPSSPVPDGAGGAWVLRHATRDVVHVRAEGEIDEELALG